MARIMKATHNKNIKFARYGSLGRAKSRAPLM